MEIVEVISKVFIELVVALMKAGDDAKAQEDALIDAEFKLARERAKRRFAQQG